MARLSLSGYVTQEVALTDGPLVWVAVNGRREGNYFILKSDHFNIELELRVKLVEGSFGTPEHTGPLPYHAPEPAPGRAAGHSAAPVVHTASEVPPTPASTGTVAITCDSSMAEVYVDGKFVGQTPATLHLTTGPHHIEIKAEGRRPWSRDLEVMKDSQISLHPVLQAGS